MPVRLYELCLLDKTCYTDSSSSIIYYYYIFTESENLKKSEEIGRNLLSLWPSISRISDLCMWKLFPTLLCPKQWLPQLEQFFGYCELRSAFYVKYSLIPTLTIWSTLYLQIDPMRLHSLQKVYCVVYSVLRDCRIISGGQKFFQSKWNI